MKIIVILIAATSMLGACVASAAEKAPSSATTSSATLQVPQQNRHIKRHHLSHRPHRHMIPKK